MEGDDMKIAYYIEEGAEQLVLTPENDYERQMLSVLDDPAKIEIYKGSFYTCYGGWKRQGEDDESRIIVMKKGETHE